MTIPRVGVLVDEKMCGAYSVAQAHEVGVLNVLPLDEALRATWKTPALFTCYSVEGETAWPRLNKRGTIRTELGDAVKTTCFAFDYDLPKIRGEKAPWEGPEAVEDFLGTLMASGLPSPTGFYLTRHGARLVYVLETPITVLEGEGYYLSMLDRFLAKGIELDRSCANWDRVFRLPFTPKTDLPLIREFFFWDSSVMLSLDGIEPRDIKIIEGPAPVYLSEPRPKEEDAADLIEFLDRDTQAVKHRAAWASAKTWLKGRDVFDSIFNGAPLPTESGRDTGILDAVGSCCNILFGKEGFTPEHVYALLMRPVAKLSPDKDQPGKDWLDVLWNQILRMWASEDSKVVQQKKALLSINENMADGFREMLAKGNQDLDELAKGEGSNPIDYMLSKLIVSAPRDGYYMLQDDGYYCPQPISRTDVAAKIRDLGLTENYGLWEKGPGGTIKAKKAQDMVDEKATVVHRVKGIVGESSARIIDLGKPAAAICKPLFGLNQELMERAEPSERVDAWLRAFFGQNYDRAVEWISHSLDLHHPICALSITGPKGVGKSLLADTLAACIDTGVKGDQGAFDQWNTVLMQTPIIHIDEGVSSLRGGGKEIDENFRVLVAGGQLTIRQKFRTDITAELFPRVLLTANGYNVVGSIVGSRDLSLHDREAIEQRLLHLDVDDTARTSIFSDNDTEEEGRAYVLKNFLGEEMNAPRHFMWLYLNRPAGTKGTGRFLVEGDIGTPLMRELSTKTDDANMVCRALIQIGQNYRAGMPGVLIREGDYLIALGMLEEWIRQDGDSRITTSRVKKVLAGSDISLSHSPRSVSNQGVSDSMWPINITLLLERAAAEGRPTGKLRTVLGLDVSTNLS